MFEDSTFESTGRIRTRSRRWMIAALAFNGSILTAMILVPLIYPEALPSHAFAFLMAVPPPPPPSPPPVVRQAASAASVPSAALQDPLAAPRQIPNIIVLIHDPGPAPTGPIGTLDTGTGAPGGMGDAFPLQPAPRVVRAAPSGPVRISSITATSIAIYRPIPAYPTLARAARVEGTVVLEATISKSGSIENLRVVSGQAMLRQAALDAVSQWRYRPYLLNGEPVAVETTVNVVFNLQR
jgi:protein TonB